MHLYLVNFLRLLHWLCLLYIVTGVKSGIADSRRKSLTTLLTHSAFGTKLTGAPSYTANRMTFPGRRIVCSHALCKTNQDRNKRSAVTDTPIAQTKRTEKADKGKNTAKPITRYAFGNPALPGSSKKRNGKPKSKRPKG